jgi:adenylate cyclase
MSTVLTLLWLAALGAAAWLFAALRRERRAFRRQLDAAAEELQQLQQACSRLAPEGVVRHMVAHGADPDPGAAAEHKVVTALFVDLVGSTALSERLAADVLARLLNGYFQRISDAVHQHRGHVSTFLGDGVLAYFGAIHPNPWQCADAVRAALAMRRAMQAYNEELAAAGLPRLAIGIGIHKGPGLAGMIGSRERREYGFVGMTVNLTARVQSLTRVHGVDLLITDAVRDELDAAFELEAMPPETVKGIAEPVRTHAVRGLAGALPAPLAASG